MDSRLATPVAFGLPNAGSTRPNVQTGALDRTIDAARQLLASLQKPDGHWCAELEGDTILESEYVLIQAFLGRVGDPKIGKCARYLLEKQGVDGGWANYPGGPADISVSVKAYFALKIAGIAQDAEPMKRARLCILELGGAETVNSFTRFYLAALGQIPYSHCPSVAPELMLLPKWCPINIYKMSAWTRTIVVPLSIFYAHQPVVELPKNLGIEELYRVPPTPGNLPAVCRIQGRLLSWSNFFRIVDRGLKIYGKVAPGIIRKKAIAKAEQWMLERFEGSDGLGAIFPPMVYTIIALKCLGYDEGSTEFRWAEKQLDDLIIEEGDTIRLQPCVSPVWDTAWATIALADSAPGVEQECVEKAAKWMLDREVRQPGDWAVHVPNVEPTGWVFEYNNRFYADLDDTAAVLMALRRTRRFTDKPCQEAIHRAVCFTLAMQCKDRGWAAFDKDIDNKVLEAIPFADHNAMLDPSCPDITARILETLSLFGYKRGQPFVDDAIRFILSRQEPEGCWFGRWGVNYIYGAWQVLVGLAAVGYDMRHPKIRKAVEWLKSVQQSSGAWGESCTSYADRSLMGQGDPTPSQTAWAVLGLMAAGEARSDAVRQGIDYLIATQRADGGWDEEPFTGTGFPKVFYLRYHYYCLYFPLMALARYRETTL